MVPTPGPPRDLLWHQQLKREHQYLLDRFVKTESMQKEESAELKERLSAAEKAYAALKLTTEKLREENISLKEQEKRLLSKHADFEATLAQTSKELKGVGSEVKHTEANQRDLERKVASLDNRPLASKDDLASLAHRFGEMEAAQSDFRHEVQRNRKRVLSNPGAPTNKRTYHSETPTMNRHLSLATPSPPTSTKEKEHQRPEVAVREGEVKKVEISAVENDKSQASSNVERRLARGSAKKSDAVKVQISTTRRRIVQDRRIKEREEAHQLLMLRRY